MNLLFTLTPAVPPEERERLAGEITRVLEGVDVVFKPDGTMLRVEGVTPDGEVAAAESVRFALLSLGFSATYLPSGGESVPPITHLPKKRPRTVRLSVFLISLISVALVCSILFAVVGFSVASRYRGTDYLGTNPSGEDYVGKISLIDEIFKNYSLYDTNGDLLLDEMLKAYATATGDDYARYYTAEEFAQLMGESTGSMVGIGVSVIENTSPAGILIVDVFENSPAATAGILPGDVVIRVGEGEGAISVAEVGYEVAVNAIRGEAGTSVTIGVLRGSETLSFTMTRAVVSDTSVSGVKSTTNPAVGIVRIKQFQNNTPKVFESVMERLISEGCTMFVFDLRNNPGGDLKSITAVLSFFLNKDDLVLSTVTKSGETTYYKNKAVTYKDEYADCSIKAENIGKYRAYKTVTLVNGNTASAAELFTAALRDYNLTTVVGETTFGKGIIQSIISLETWGYEGAVKLTTGYYNPPSGVNYHGVGIAPTDGYAVALDESLWGTHLYLLTEAEDNQLQAAISALN